MDSNTLIEMYTDISQNREQIEAKAELFNCVAVFADDSTLQLDLDTPEAVAFFHEQWSWVFGQILPCWGAVSTYVYPEFSVSKSGHTHVTIRLGGPIPVRERMLIQALLGSDLKRELLNYTRLLAHGADLTCLFVPKPKLLAGEVE